MDPVSYKLFYLSPEVYEYNKTIQEFLQKYIYSVDINIIIAVYYMDYNEYKKEYNEYKKDYKVNNRKDVGPLLQPLNYMHTLQQLQKNLNHFHVCLTYYLSINNIKSREYEQPIKYYRDTKKQIGYIINYMDYKNFEVNLEGKLSAFYNLIGFMYGEDDAGELLSSTDNIRTKLIITYLLGKDFMNFITGSSGISSNYSLGGEVCFYYGDDSENRRKLLKFADKFNYY